MVANGPQDTPGHSFSDSVQQILEEGVKNIMKL